MTQVLELAVQVLVEMEDGADVTRFARDYVEGAIPKMFSASRDIRSIITISDSDDNVVATKFNNNPTEALREKAWT